MKSILGVFDQSSFFMIPSSDWHIQDEDTTIAFQSDSWDACEIFCDKSNDKLLGVTYTY